MPYLPQTITFKKFMQAHESFIIQKSKDFPLNFLINCYNGIYLC